MLFPFADYWWFYAFFVLMVVGFVALDLGVFNRAAHKVHFKEASIWSIVWVTVALVFNYGFYKYALWDLTSRAIADGTSIELAASAAKNAALEFLTGYVVEKSLAIDNIFVFVVIFNYFAIPPRFQHRVLFYGLIGALVFRGIFIALGAVLLQYEVVVWIFGIFLILTGFKLYFTPEKQSDLEKNLALRVLKKFMPISNRLHGRRLFVKKEGKVFATPLFVTLLLVEFSDIVFAVDSVPAIFAITKEPLIVFTSNIFALLGLRSLYFLLADVVDRFYLLKYGLATVLIFVGLKMVWLNEAFDGKFPIVWSLAIIGGVVGLSILLSFLIPKREDPK